MTLDAAQVEQVLRPKAEVLEYEKIRSDYPDTVEGQWALAEWCREKKLLDKRETHLNRIIELDPDHADARRLLGYTKIDGKWQRRSDLMKERGYVYSKGRWMLPQEVEQQAEKAKHEAAAAEWAQKISRWRKWLGTKRNDEARENFRKITDPAAIKPIVVGLRSEASADVRLLLIEVLRNINTPESERALAIAAIDDASEEVRLTCLDYLKTKKRPEVVGYFVGKLKAKDNITVNLAGVALREMKDPSAIGPLIDARGDDAQIQDHSRRRRREHFFHVQQRPRRGWRRAFRGRTAANRSQELCQSSRARRLGGHHRAKFLMGPSGLESLGGRAEAVRIAGRAAGLVFVCGLDRRHARGKRGHRAKFGFTLRFSTACLLCARASGYRARRNERRDLQGWDGKLSATGGGDTMR